MVNSAKYSVQHMKRYTLALDTSTLHTSAALSTADDQIYCVESRSELSHIEELDALISEVLSLGDVKISQIQELLIGSGPGSFTGLRIGFSFISGLALALNTPVYPVLSFKGYLPEDSLYRSALIATVADAGRGELYCALLKEGEGLNDSTLLLPAQISSSEHFEQQVETLLNQNSSESSVALVTTAPEICKFSRSFWLPPLAPNKVARGLLKIHNIRRLAAKEAQGGVAALKLQPLKPTYLREVNARKRSDLAR